MAQFIIHAALDIVDDQLVKLVRSCLVTNAGPLQSARARPATIAVQDDGNVFRHELLKYLVAKSARVDAVNRRKEECFGGASHLRHRAETTRCPNAVGSAVK